MAFDVARIRGLYPGLGAGGVRLDGSAGMLVPEDVASAVCTAMRTPFSAPGGAFPASRRADDLLAEARAAVADLVGARPETVVLGPNTTVLLTRLADALAGTWTLGDDVVLSRLDEQATLAPSPPGCVPRDVWARTCGGVRSTSRRASCPPGSTRS